MNYRNARGRREGILQKVWFCRRVQVAARSEWERGYNQGLLQAYMAMAMEEGLGREVVAAIRDADAGREVSSVRVERALPVLPVADGGVGGLRVFHWLVRVSGVR